jgi:hypothetical protein
MNSRASSSGLGSLPLFILRNNLWSKTSSPSSSSSTISLFQLIIDVETLIVTR